MRIIGDLPLRIGVVVRDIAKMDGCTDILRYFIVLNPLHLARIDVLVACLVGDFCIILRIRNQYNREWITVIAACILTGSRFTVAEFSCAACFRLRPDQTTGCIGCTCCNAIAFAFLFACFACILALARSRGFIAFHAASACNGLSPFGAAVAVRIFTFRNTIIVALLIAGITGVFAAVDAFKSSGIAGFACCAALSDCPFGTSCGAGFTGFDTFVRTPFGGICITRFFTWNAASCCIIAVRAVLTGFYGMDAAAICIIFANIDALGRALGGGIRIACGRTLRDAFAGIEITIGVSWAFARFFPYCAARRVALAFEQPVIRTLGRIVTSTRFSAAFFAFQRVFITMCTAFAWRLDNPVRARIFFVFADSNAFKTAALLVANVACVRAVKRFWLHR